MIAAAVSIRGSTGVLDGPTCLRFTCPMPDVTPSARHSGVVYASSGQGYELPVIDVSLPAFAVADDPQSMEGLRRTFAESEQRRKRLPKFMLKWLLRWMSRRSQLARELFYGATEVLSGMSTYVMKLGSANLVAPFNTSLDQQLAAAPGVISMRLRLQQLAQMTAAGLRNDLLARPHAPLHLVNIGGGTAIDSLNILILLRRSTPAALRRPITIHLLDPDTAGPQFGQRALDSLLQGGPLAGLTVRFLHTPYNWNDTQPLISLVQELSLANTIVVASTEGALFEYADDATVLSNLSALRAGGGVTLVAGTVTRADPLTREFLTTSRFKLVPRGAEGLQRLATQAGFALAQVESALLSDQVLLRPAAASLDASGPLVAK